MKVTRSIMERIRRPGGTIGQLEALAGLPSDEESRRAFWIECDRMARERLGVRFADPATVFDVGRERCYELVVQRIAKGEVCIL